MLQDAVLSQGEQHDAAVNFDRPTCRILQRQRAVLTAIARLSN